MRLGLIARADNSGLGVQTHNFYLHMRPDKTLVVDISELNGNKVYPERYPDKAVFVKGIPQKEDIDIFLQDLDVVFVAEAPYNYYLYDRARELGVKTAVQYNYEFLDWYAYPWYPKPDMLIAPSKWHYEDVQKFCDENHIKHVYLHCPVDREKLPFTSNKDLSTFLHVAGRSAAFDRNGTETVINAAKFLKTDAKILIHFQGEQGLGHQATKSYADYLKLVLEQSNKNITIEKLEFENYEQVYNRGDVMLLPRRYGGNCLPLNEALSVGMPVIMPDISPNNAWLPPNWLLPAEKISQFTPRTVIDIYGVRPELLAAKIDEMYSLSQTDAYDQTMVADALANQISWETMKPMYDKTFEELCTP